MLPVAGPASLISIDSLSTPGPAMDLRWHKDLVLKRCRQSALLTMAQDVTQQHLSRLIYKTGPIMLISFLSNCTLSGLYYTNHRSANLCNAQSR